jgi:small subunit ribosomal protein S17
MKTILGKVISDKMKNTAVVLVERTVAHPLYHKRIRHSKKYHADNTMGAKVNDTVQLSPARRLSKTKFWKVTQIIK